MISGSAATGRGFSLSAVLCTAALAVLVAGCGNRAVDLKDAGLEDAEWPRCTLSMCRVNDAGTEACCFNAEFEPPKPYGVCCYGLVPGMATCAYNAKEDRYIMFCDGCLPSGWSQRDSPYGTCP
jgi:hypothetical protein